MKFDKVIKESELLQVKMPKEGAVNVHDEFRSNFAAGDVQKASDKDKVKLDSEKAEKSKKEKKSKVQPTKNSFNMIHKSFGV